MSQENVELVPASLEAWNAPDMEAPFVSWPAETSPGGPRGIAVDSGTRTGLCPMKAPLAAPLNSVGCRPGDVAGEVAGQPTCRVVAVPSPRY